MSAMDEITNVLTFQVWVSRSRTSTLNKPQRRRGKSREFAAAQLRACAKIHLKVARRPLAADYAALDTRGNAWIVAKLAAKGRHIRTKGTCLREAALTPSSGPWDLLQAEINGLA